MAAQVCDGGSHPRHAALPSPLAGEGGARRRMRGFSPHTQRSSPIEPHSSRRCAASHPLPQGARVHLHRGTLVTRQIDPLPASDTSSAPSFATATPTGRPHTSVSLTTNPVTKSSYSPVGLPSFIRIRITL